MRSNAKWIWLSFLSGAPLLACSCSHLTVDQILQNPVIFVGEVIDGGVTSLKDDPWHSDAKSVRFRILENFRGLSREAKTVEVKLQLMKGMCSPIPYFPGKRYLVTPMILGKDLVDGMCFTGRQISRAVEEVEQVRDHFECTTAATARLQGWVGGVSKPFSGVPVSAAAGGKVYSTKTGQGGRYRLDLPSGGTYRVTTTVTHSQMTVQVPQRGCRTVDFEIPQDNSISGQILDDEGDPVAAEVGLLDLDAGQHQPLFSYAFARGPQNTFRIDDVPLGRYLLMVNPRGPSERAPFEPTFYPRATSRHAARIIEIKSNGTHLQKMDLVVGKPVEFRKVTVRVKFSDGSFMKTAKVRCIGTAELAGGTLEWRAERGTASDGWAQFDAPVNRTIKIEVEDGYGRDLKRPYVATFPPGRTPIHKDFVIVP